MAVPAFDGRLRVLPVPGAGALLLSDDVDHFLPGSAYESVVPLVDGRRSSEEIVAAAVDGGLDAALAWYVLFRLESAGHLTPSRPEVPPNVGAFWSGLGIDPAEALAALRAARVRVFSVGSAAADAFRAALGSCGITASLPSPEEVGAGSESDFDIVLAGDYLSDALLPFDTGARAAHRRWMLVRPAGFEIWIGPLFQPGRTGCLHCLRHKLARYRSAHRVAARLEPARGSATPLPGVAATEDAALQLAALESARALAGVDGDLTGGMLTIDLCDRSTRTHRLIRHPQCRACGQTPTREAAPLRLQSRQAAIIDADGGYRTTPPEETLKKYRHLVSPITGIVPKLEHVGIERRVGHVYMAGCDRIQVALDSREGFLVYRNYSAGKGMTAAQARASALGEAIERYSFERQGTEATVPGSFRELGADAIHPNDVMNFSELQYRERDSRNRAYTGRRHYVPEPFDPDARIDWTALWSLSERRHKLLPTELLFFRSPRAVEPPRRPPTCICCSNGCASGNTLEEAVLQGFLEVIERDAIAMWWYNRLRRPAIDLASFGDRWLSDVAAEYDRWGRDVVAIDLTNDLGIPVVASVSHVRTGLPERILVGFGCHVDVRIAAQRAVSEMCQMLVIEIGAEVPAYPDREYRKWFESATRAEQPHLVPDETAAPRRRDDFPPPPRRDLLTGAIERCRESVESHGMEVLVLDQTRPDVGMPVAKVVVPGLRHFWARFAPGRLYDVPVASGLLAAPLDESDLNPVPCFL